MRLNKQELEFIRLATIISDGVYDYSVLPFQFKETYGIAKEDTYEMLQGLKLKCNNELYKKSQRKIKQAKP